MSNRWIGKTRLAGLLLVSLLASMAAVGATPQNRPRYGGRQMPAGSGVIPENTIISVLSDHGESLGEHGEYTHGVFVYDSTLRIAFLMSGPGIPAGEARAGHRP